MRGHGQEGGRGCALRRSEAGREEAGRTVPTQSTARIPEARAAATHASPGSVIHREEREGEKPVSLWLQDPGKKQKPSPAADHQP